MWTSPSRGPTGRRVTGLTRDDFEIVAGGAARPVESFAAGKEQPLSLVLLLDASASLEFMVERKVLRAAIEKWFVGQLAPQDRVQVGSFAKQISIGPALAGNPRSAPRGRTDGARSARRGYARPLPDLGRGRRRRGGARAGERPARSSARDRRTSARATGKGPKESGARAIAAGVVVNVVGEDWEMTLRQDGTTGVRVRPGVALEWIRERDRRAVRP